MTQITVDNFVKETLAEDNLKNDNTTIRTAKDRQILHKKSPTGGFSEISIMTTAKKLLDYLL